MKVNERFIWASIIIDIKPTDRVLEIGCGAGLLIEQMANKIGSGRISAIDRSASMIRMATNRNTPFIKSGKVELTTVEFSESDFKKSEFNKIVSFNVNFFWKDAERELEIIKRILQPGGELYIFYQAPFDIDIKAAEPIKEKLGHACFEITDTILKKMKPASAFCVKSKARLDKDNLV